MVAPLTENRRKKVELLREALNGIIDILLREHTARDSINMAKFKRLSSLVKEVREQAEIRKSKAENYTKNSEIGRDTPPTPEESVEGTKL
jgi:hypothetical protein